MRFTAPLDDHRQFPGHPPSRDRCVRDRAQAFLGDIVDDVEDAEAPSVGKLVVDEVEGPACVWFRFHQDWRPGACRLAAGPTLADSEPFLPIEAVDPVDPGRLALPPQQDEQPAIAEPAAFIGQLAQPGAELDIRRPARAVADHLPIRAHDRTGPPLRQANLGLQMRHRGAFGGGPYHFL